MSKRRRSWEPYAGVTADDLYRACYGSRAKRDAADLTTAPAVEDFDPWLCALRGLVLAVGGFAVCVAAFVTTLHLLARGW